MLYSYSLSADGVKTNSYYEYMLNLMRMMIEGAIDGFRYETDMQNVLGSNAYITFSVEKILHNIVKQVGVCFSTLYYIDGQVFVDVFLLFKYIHLIRFIFIQHVTYFLLSLSLQEKWTFVLLWTSFKYAMHYSIRSLSFYFVGQSLYSC